jgi:hypothetical protein
MNLGYDPLGRLHFRVVGASGPIFQYDGTQLIRELDAGGTIRRHVFGPAVDEPLLSYERNGSGGFDKRCAHADERGSIIATSDAICLSCSRRQSAVKSAEASVASANGCCGQTQECGCPAR